MTGMLKMSLRHSKPALYVCVLRECVTLTSACGFFVAGKLPASHPYDMPPRSENVPGNEHREAPPFTAPRSPRPANRSNSRTSGARNRDSSADDPTRVLEGVGDTSSHRYGERLGQVAKRRPVVNGTAVLDH